MKKLLLCFGLLIAVHTCTAVNIDSLLDVWRDHRQPDSIRLVALYDAAYELIYIDRDTALYFAELQYDFALKSGYPVYAANARYIQGVNYYYAGLYTEALEHYQLSLNLFEELEKEASIASCLNNMGAIFTLWGDYLVAVSFYTRSLKIAEQLKDSLAAYNALKNIGDINRRQKDYTKAMEYNQLCLQSAIQRGDKNGEASCLSTIGLIHYEQGDLEKALAYQLKSLEIFRQQGPKSSEAYVLRNMGPIYQEQGQDAKVVEVYRQSLELFKEISDVRGIIDVDIAMSRFYLERGKYAQAITYSRRGLDMAREIGLVVEIKDAALVLFESYQKAGNYKQALDMHLLYRTMEDSMASEAAAREVMRQEFTYKYEKKATADSIRALEKEKVMQAELAAEKALSQQQRQQTYFLYTGLGLTLLFCGFIVNRMMVIRKQKALISLEKERSDELLRNILPDETAEELKKYGSAKARHFDMVSVIFTDFKGFTHIAEKLSPTELVAEIDYCYKAFDKIVEKFGLEKIKTIGDAYMCASGLPKQSEECWNDAVRAAIAIRNFMKQYKAQREAEGRLAFEVRIGVHSGPVVAGIVGAKKFAYDIWGDTVNTAARMESSGAVGKVNISGSTYDLVEGKFKCEYRGKIPVKNKGEIDMYFAEESGKLVDLS